MSEHVADGEHMECTHSSLASSQLATAATIGTAVMGVSNMI